MPVNNTMDDGKKTEAIRIALSDELLLRITKMAIADDRAVSDWARRQLTLICDLHDRGIDLAVVNPRRALSPGDDC